MTSPLSSISNAAVNPIGPVRRPDQTAGALDGAAGDLAGTTGSGTTAENFAGAIGQAIGDGLDQINQLDQAVSEASQQAAVGNLDSVSDFMIATAEAQLATEITVAVRDRAITAFNDIMRMQI
ncbi:MAG: flagellar hook-basal body complex protein FliE [Actinomycetota bacterium]